MDLPAQCTTDGGKAQAVFVRSVLTAHRITCIIQLNCSSRVIQFAERGGGPLVSFDDFIMEPGVPIYAQIIRYVKGAVAAGAVADGEELPSRRILSALLGVNPNTIQKAY